MPSKPTDPAALRVEIAEDGTASLSGVNYQDLRNILTLASLQRYAEDEKPLVRPLDGSLDDVVHANNVDDAAYRLWSRTLLDMLKAHMAEAIRPGYSDGKPAAERALRQYHRDLKTVDADVRELEAEAAAAKAALPAPAPDPLAEISRELSQAVRAADGALAKLERARAQGRA